MIYNCIIVYKPGQTVTNQPNNYKMHIVFHDKSGISGKLPDPCLDKHHWSTYRIRYVEISSYRRFNSWAAIHNVEVSL